jgi:hypothetical protein
MSLTAAIIAIAAADVAIVALLAFVMSRASGLTPHATTAAIAARPARARAAASVEHRRAAGRRRVGAPALSARA